MKDLQKRIDVIAVGHAPIDIRVRVNESPKPDQESPILKTKWGQEDLL